MGTGVETELEMGLEMEMGMSTPQCILGNAVSREQSLGRALSANVVISYVGTILGDGRQRAEAQKSKNKRISYSPNPLRTI